jgi:hypothetical protein
MGGVSASPATARGGAGLASKVISPGTSNTAEMIATIFRMTEITTLDREVLSLMMNGLP